MNKKSRIGMTIVVLTSLFAGAVHAGTWAYELTVTAAGTDSNGITQIGLASTKPNVDLNPGKCSESYYRFEGAGAKSALASALSATALNRKVDVIIENDCPGGARKLSFILLK